MLIQGESWVFVEQVQKLLLILDNCLVSMLEDVMPYLYPMLSVLELTVFCNDFSIWSHE